ncbi:MAG: hypothetical protein JXA33_01675 [Anaerolineae bacterium]|nr:hypothetical protein [Anaerolineae bacterium]
MQSLSRRQKTVLIIMAIADIIVVGAMAGVIITSLQALNQPLPTPTVTPLATMNVGPTWTPTITTTPRPTIPPRATKTPPQTPTPYPTPTYTPIPPTPTPGPIVIINPDFDLLMPNRIPGWSWDAFVNYQQGDADYSPENSYAEPLFTAADDPVRQIHGTTLKIETIRWLKFRAWVHQTVSVTAGSTIYFEAKANAYSSLDRVKFQVGIDPTGAENCYDAQWGSEQAIRQEDGIITLKSPRVVVGEEGKVTICLFAEPTYAHVNNAAFFDQAEIIRVAGPPLPP